MGGVDGGCDAAGGLHLDIVMGNPLQSVIAWTLGSAVGRQLARAISERI